MAHSQKNIYFPSLSSVAAMLVKMKEPGIDWVGLLCRRPVGCRRMLLGYSRLAAVASEDHVGLN